MVDNKVEDIKSVNDPQAGDNDAKSQVISSVDYTEDQTVGDSIPSLQIGGDYDPRPHEDKARRTIAYLLIGLLWFVVIEILILLSFEAIAVQEIKEFGVILSPVITLVSAATGFYYGTKSNSTNGK